MLSSSMLPLNLIPLIDVTFSTPTPDFNSDFNSEQISGPVLCVSGVASASGA